ncbi:MAG: arginine--tRNA ligase [Solirubrobacterales bacterium]|nr:arginine--tRNA ligase [Solirubrobacterales bacterium]
MTAPADPDPLAALRASVLAAAEGLDGAGGGRATLERPPKPELGDYSTNAAMLLAPALAAPSREVAERLRDALRGSLGSSAERIDVAGPGFVNVFLSDRWHREATASLLAAGDRLGTGRPERPLRVLVEFVSANPTGPVTVAAGRGAAYGDSVARLLELAGHEVEREYYLNDAGTQVRLFAESIAARMRGDEPPEGGYAGEYVAELAGELAARGASGDDLDDLGRRGTEAMRERIEATLERFGVRFDSWFSERRLYAAKLIDAAIAELRERGHVFETEGAIWLRTTEFGDDKDRVLIRADGEPTYFAADIAYHRDKIERRAERLVTPLGADHHGYIPRMRAALAALGVDPDRYEAPIMQLVNIVEGGQRARMSKREGDFVTLDELIDDIGVDAARFFMVQRSHDTAFDLDLDLARSASQDNPVYYVQYAHARLASILRKAGAGGAGGGGDEAAFAVSAADESSLAAAAEPAERALLRRLLELPGEVRTAAERRAPHRLIAYAMATAADFHAFYRDCRVVGAERDTEAARLGLCVATKRTVATTLGLIGVGSPERM